MLPNCPPVTPYLLWGMHEQPRSPRIHSPLKRIVQRKLSFHHSSLFGREFADTLADRHSAGTGFGNFCKRPSDDIGGLLSKYASTDGRWRLPGKYKPLPGFSRRG